jgi:hypothetical protein
VAHDKNIRPGRLLDRLASGRDFPASPGALVRGVLNKVRPAKSMPKLHSK